MEWLINWWNGRSLARTGRTRIADLVPGKVAKIVGRAHAVGEPIAAPFTGQPAATLRVAGHRIEYRPRQSPYVRLDDVDFGHAFYVEDESGIAAVERRGWSELIAPGAHITGEDPRAEQNIDLFFARYGNEHRSFFDGFGLAVFYDEWVIPEGATVAVLGAVEAASAPIERPSMQGYRGHARAMAIVPPARGKLLISVDRKHVAR